MGTSRMVAAIVGLALLSLGAGKTPDSEIAGVHEPPVVDIAFEPTLVAEPYVSAEDTVGLPGLEPASVRQQNPRVTSLANGEHLLSWVDGLYGVVALRLNAQGDATPGAVPFGLLPRLSLRPSHAIACLPMSCLLVTVRQGELAGTWLDGAGVPLDEPSFAIAADPAADYVAEIVASDGDFRVYFGSRGLQALTYDVMRRATITPGGNTVVSDVVTSATVVSFSATHFGPDDFLAVRESNSSELRNVTQNTVVVSNFGAGDLVALGASIDAMLLLYTSGGSVAGRWYDSNLVETPLAFPSAPGLNSDLRIDVAAGQFYAMGANPAGQTQWVSRITPFAPMAPTHASASSILANSQRQGAATQDAWFTDSVGVATGGSGVAQITRHDLASSGQVLGVTRASSRHLSQLRVSLRAKESVGRFASWVQRARFDGAGNKADSFSLAAQRLDDNGAPLGPELNFGQLPSNTLDDDLPWLPSAIGSAGWHLVASGGPGLRWITVPFDESQSETTQPITAPVDRTDWPIGGWSHLGEPVFAFRRFDTGNMFPKAEHQLVLRAAPNDSVGIDMRGIQEVAGVTMGNRSLVLTVLRSTINGENIHGQWLDAALGLSAPFVVASEDGAQRNVAVAQNGSMALAVWLDEREGGAQVRAARIDPSGVLLDSEAFVIAPQLRAERVDVAAIDSERFVVAWLGSAAGAPERTYVAFVTNDGVVLDPQGVVVSPPGELANSVSVVQPSDGVVELAYTRGDLPRSESRAFQVRLGAGLANGSLCQADDECGSRACENQICCAESCGECESCTSDGVCEPVTSATDDTCFGDSSCSATGTCLDANGQACTDASECASGECVDGFCCDTSCEGACERCDANAGVCQVQDCAGYQCDDQRQCLDSCDSGADCAAGYRCDSDGSCAVIDATDMPAGGEDGCGCRLVSARTPYDRAAWFWLTLLGACLAGSRRIVKKANIR